MMKLSLMVKFFETVREDWESPIANDIAARWFLGSVTVKCVRASANFVFSVQAPDARYFLRFSHASEREVPVIKAELDYVNHLSRSGIHVAEPLPSLSGNLVETVNTTLGEFHAVLFTALPGRHWSLEALDERQYELWGRNLGALHCACRGFETTERLCWLDHVLFAKRAIPASEENALRELHVISEALSNLPTDRANYSLVHYDFELDNIVWENDEAGILDFDDCVFHWHEGDIAFALRDLFDDRVENVDLKNDRFAAFLKGYRSANRIDDAAIQRIPLFLRLHGLIRFARLIYALNNGFEHDKSCEPQWATNLRGKLGDAMDKCRDGFRNHPIDDFLRDALPTRFHRVKIRERV